jgi:hypothetical protein
MINVCGKIRLTGRSRGWWIGYCGRSSCQISHTMPYFHRSSPASCTKYRHIWSPFCKFIFLISLETNSINTGVTLHKKDAFRNTPDMVCRIAGCSDVANYTLGMVLIWYSSPNITSMIMGKTCRTRKTLKQIIWKGVHMYGLLIFI